MSTEFLYESLHRGQHPRAGSLLSLLAVLKQKRYVWTAALFLGVIVFVSVASKHTDTLYDSRVSLSICS